MSDDIVTRLHKADGYFGLMRWRGETLTLEEMDEGISATREAADEIERLRAELAEAKRVNAEYHLALAERDDTYREAHNAQVDRLRAAEADRDRLQAAYNKRGDYLVIAYTQRDLARAEVARLREAVEKVAETVTYYMRPDSGAVDDGMLADLATILDAALAEGGETNAPEV